MQKPNNKVVHFTSSQQFKTQSLAYIVMATVFRDAKGAMIMDYLPCGQTVTLEYYSVILGCFSSCWVSRKVGKGLKRHASWSYQSVYLSTCSWLSKAFLPQLPYPLDLATTFSSQTWKENSVEATSGLSLLNKQQWSGDNMNPSPSYFGPWTLLNKVHYP